MTKFIEEILSKVKNERNFASPRKRTNAKENIAFSHTTQHRSSYVVAVPSLRNADAFPAENDSGKYVCIPRQAKQCQT